MEIPFQIFAFVWGAVWGSFLNVVIYRMPMGMSLSHPPSRCGHCLTRIRWFDNVPILSYLILRGRCRRCGATYSPRYMLVEAACGLMVLLAFRVIVLPLTPETFVNSLLVWAWVQAFIYALVAITFIDLEHTYIPDAITLPMIAVGVCGAFWLPTIEPLSRFWGALGGAGFIVLVAAVGYLIFRREAMGMGDAKLLAMIGAFLGWRALPFVLFASAIQAILATLIAVVYSRITGKQNSLTMTTDELDERFGEEDLYDDDKVRVAIPYGPFLALAALEALLLGYQWFWSLAERFLGA